MEGSRCHGVDLNMGPREVRICTEDIPEKVNFGREDEGERK